MSGGARLQEPGFRQPVFAIARGRGTGSTRRRLQEQGFGVFVMPAVGRKVRAERGEIDDADFRRVELGQQPAAHPGRRKLRRPLHSLSDRMFHELERHGNGNVEDFPLMRGIAFDIGIFRIDLELLRRACHENAGTRNDQRPERLQFGIRQRADGMERLHRRQDLEGITARMMQQRCAGNGKIGDHPPFQHVAEIDDAVRDEAPALSARLTTLSSVTS